MDGDIQQSYTAVTLMRPYTFGHLVDPLIYLQYLHEPADGSNTEAAGVRPASHDCDYQGWKRKTRNKIHK